MDEIKPNQTESTALARAQNRWQLPVNSIQDLQVMAGFVSASGLFAGTDEAQLAVQLMAGLEAGFSPFASITGVFVINGKPGFGSNMLAQAIKRSGRYDYRVVQKNLDGCKINILDLKSGQVIGTEEFSREMAERARLWGNRGPWTSYPEAMLFARCISSAVRTHCPDVLGGHIAYTPEELGGDQIGTIDEHGMVTQVKVQEEPNPVVAVNPQGSEAVQDVAQKLATALDADLVPMNSTSVVLDPDPVVPITNEQKVEAWNKLKAEPDVKNAFLQRYYPTQTSLGPSDLKLKEHYDYIITPF